VDDEKSTEENPRKTYFIDLGVYTRNRVFRLMASTKFGKRPDAGLRIAKSNRFAFPRGFGNSNFYLPSMASSSTNSNEEVRRRKIKKNRRVIVELSYSREARRWFRPVLPVS